METNLLDRMLGLYRSQGKRVTLILQNRNRISGRIRMFDGYVIVMENERNEIIYRHSVSSLLPFAETEQPRPQEQKNGIAKAAPRTVKQAASTAQRQRTAKPAPLPAAPPSDRGLNEGMKDGLLRWMREHQTK